MIEFGRKVRRLPKDLANERARIRKGKVFGGKRSTNLQTMDHLTLPNIATTQLTQNWDIFGDNWRNLREAKIDDKGRTATPHQPITKQGRLMDSTSMLEHSGDNFLENFEGLLVSKLHVRGESTEEPKEFSTSPNSKRQRKQCYPITKSRDSGFFDDSSCNDYSAVAHAIPASSANSVDKALCGREIATEPKKRPRVGLELKMLLNQNKPVVRNTERFYGARAKMCLQSTQSLHADLIALKNVSSHNKGSISDPGLKTKERCLKMREVTLSKAHSDDDGVKQFADSSLAVFKTRRDLNSGKLKSRPPFPSTERRCRNKERVLDPNNCDHVVESEDVEQEDRSARKCASCPVDLPSSESKQKPSNDDLNRNLDCAISTLDLTGKDITDAFQSKEIIGVNVKCQEWLNRWIGCNQVPQTINDSDQYSFL